MNFQESLDELMKAKNVNALDIQRDTKIPNSGIYNYLNYAKDISMNTLITLADYFEVSLDYMAGRTDVKTSKGKGDVEAFRIRLDQLLREHGITKNKLKSDLKLSNNQVAKWMKGSVPRLASLMMLADYFACSIDYFAGLD